jgi:branched-chain amino acid transport system ATP-binding protein
MLKVSGAVSGYGRVNVLRSVSIEVKAGAIIGILGANGAGKSTLLQTISGLVPLRRGSIAFDGQEIGSLRADKIVAMGLVHVPQGRMLFPEMSVLENLEMGGFLERDRRRFQQDLEKVYAIFPILRERRTQSAAYLSGGEQQMLAIGRALMAAPKFLTLDEPSLGLGPRVFDDILAIIQTINRAGMPIVIAEQNARKMFRISHYCYVIENGAIALEGPSSELARDERVRKIYLGSHDEDAA